MLLSTSFNKVKSANGSAVVGFAIGAPFVLLSFFGFLNISKMAWIGVVAEVKMFNIAQAFSFNSGISDGTFGKIYLEGLDVYVPRGSSWGLSRVIE